MVPQLKPFKYKTNKKEKTNVKWLSHLGGVGVSIRATYRSWLNSRAQLTFSMSSIFESVLVAYAAFPGFHTLKRETGKYGAHESETFSLKQRQCHQHVHENIRQRYYSARGQKLYNMCSILHNTFMCAREITVITLQALKISKLAKSVLCWAGRASDCQGQMKRILIGPRGLFSNYCNYVWSKSRSNFLSKCSHWTPCCLQIHLAETELEPNRLFRGKRMWQQQMTKVNINHRSEYVAILH